jgi:hypothetical protein
MIHRMGYRWYGTSSWPELDIATQAVYAVCAKPVEYAELSHSRLLTKASAHSDL